MLTALSKRHHRWVPLQVQHAAHQSYDLLAGSPTSRWAAPVLWGIFAGVAVRLPATRMEEDMRRMITWAGQPRPRVSQSLWPKEPSCLCSMRHSLRLLLFKDPPARLDISCFQAQVGRRHHPRQGASAPWNITVQNTACCCSMSLSWQTRHNLTPSHCRHQCIALMLRNSYYKSRG